MAVAAATVVILAGLEARLVAVKVNGPPNEPVVIFCNARVAGLGVLVKVQTIFEKSFRLTAGMVMVLPATTPPLSAVTAVRPAGRVSVTDTGAVSDGPLFTTTSEYVTLPPATTVAGPVLVIARSAEAVTPVLVDEVLLAGTGSAVVDDTDAVFVRLPACAGAVTTTVIAGAVAPVARVGRVHPTDTLPVLVQVQPAPAADTKVTPAGRVSVTETAAASDGPLSTTDNEYVTLAPATTVAGPVLVIARSAEAVTPVVIEDVLFAGTGSAVVDDTEAVLVSEAVCAGAVTTTVMVGAVTPVASAGWVQVTDVLATLVHVQPVPAADTNVTPAGRVSVTETAAASDGPLLTITREYVTVPLAVTVPGPVLVIERSAEALTVVFTVEVLFPGTGSAVVDDTDAVFVRAAAWAGAVTTTVIVGAVAPVTSAGRVQVTEVLPTLVHVHPVPAAETKVTPAGKVSATDTAAASDGPLSTTTRE